MSKTCFGSSWTPSSVIKTKQLSPHKSTFRLIIMHSLIDLCLWINNSATLGQTNPFQVNVIRILYIYEINHYYYYLRYYMPKESKSLRQIGFRNRIRHSMPVMELRWPFIKTYLRMNELRYFHWIHLKKSNFGRGLHPIIPLHDHIRQRAQVRFKANLFFFSFSSIVLRGGLIIF